MFIRTRRALDRIGWIRRLKQTPAGRVLKKVMGRFLRSGEAHPEWQLLHEPIEVPCNLCGSHSSIPICENLVGLPVVRCRECNLIYVGRQPAMADLQTRYDGYMAHERSGQDWVEWMDERAARLDEWGIGEFERVLGPDRRVLELGCAEGYELVVFKQRGWRVRGYDVNARAVDHAANVFGLDVDQCGFGPLPEPDNAFDLAALFHTIEHVPDAQQTVHEICRVLKPGGRMLIVTPCADTIVSRSVGDVWFSDPDHMFFFSQNTIQTLLENNGFEIVDMRTWLGVTAPAGESGEAAHRLWRRDHSIEDDRGVLEQNQGDVMMVMALKKRTRPV